ncbi:MAG: hypothetical protein HC915_18570 [Anaerolineae bacterium]|nr:hypothetical protein [Anaerolineae bacterium]
MAFTLTQVFLLIAWFASSGLIFVLAMIARFYEMTSGQRTLFRYYLAPVVLFSLGMARYLAQDAWAGDALADALLLAGALLAVVLSVWLYQQMTWEGE